MARLECDTETEDGVTLVEVRLASDHRERVTLEPTHEGPCWPPRRNGVPEAGWSAQGWTGVVPADEPLALGYATPADPDDPPVRIVDSEPATDEEKPATPRDVLRALGDPRPPRDAVQPPGKSAETDEVASDATDGTDVTERGNDRRSGDPPRAELDAIAARVDRAEALAAVGSVEEAREAVAAAGGVDAVRDLVGQLERDRERLARLQERAAALSERAAVDVPIEDIARLV